MLIKADAKNITEESKVNTRLTNCWILVAQNEIIISSNLLLRH